MAASPDLRIGVNMAALQCLRALRVSVVSAVTASGEGRVEEPTPGPSMEGKTVGMNGRGVARIRSRLQIAPTKKEVWWPYR